MKSKTYQAQKVGIKVGAFVTQKKATTVKIFKVTSISDADGANVEFEGVATKVPVAELLDAWRVHKGKVSEMVEFETPLPHELEAWGMEAVKGAIAIAIRNEFAKNKSTMELIQVFANPTTVKAARNLMPNELQLVAASQRVDKKHAETSIPLGEFKVSPENHMELFLLPHFVPPTSSTGDANKAPFNSPFWCVKSSDTAKGANVVVTWNVVEVGGITVNVPVLTNRSAMKEGEELRLFFKGITKPNAAVTPAAKKRRA